MRQIRTFVVTIVVEEETPEQWHGQMTEPIDSPGWRVTFASADELNEAIKRRLISQPASQQRCADLSRD